MPTEIKEYNELIAVRVPPSDRWRLVDDQQKIIHPTLTDTLEAYFHKTGFKGSYRLDPLNSKLYAIKETTEEIPEEAPKQWNIYNEFSQGI